MECKEFRYAYMQALFVHWNISRMECKDISIAYLSTSELYWNISRMECKVSFLTDCSISISLEYIQNGM